jgi:hypothetical protein
LAINTPLAARYRKAPFLRYVITALAALKRTYAPILHTISHSLLPLLFFSLTGQLKCSLIHG